MPSDLATNKLTSDSQEMANILQSQYCSVFAPPKTNYNFPNLNEPEEKSKLIPFLQTQLLDQMVYQQYFSKCANHHSKPLKIIWQSNFNQGTIPRF